MVKNPKQPVLTKKHLARMERERIQRRYILLGSIVVFIIIFGLIGYGLLDQYYLRERKPVAVVNGEKIQARYFAAVVRFRRNQLISNAVNVFEYIKLFGDSPQTQASFLSQLEQIQTQLVPDVVGEAVMDQMIDATILRQEAQRRNISISMEEIDKILQEGFGFYKEGTPTTEPTQESIPTSTLSPQQLALLQPTPTSTATPVITSSIAYTQAVPLTATPTQILTPTPTLAPTATPTLYTLEQFQSDYKELIKSYEDNLALSEEDYRSLVETQLYVEKLSEIIFKELNVPHEQEQVWARHILISEETKADEILTRLKEGDDWYALAALYSTDTSNKDKGGDLGWFSKGDMVPEFEQSAFALSIGEIVSQPVKTQFGWHIIQVLGHEMRPLSDYEYKQLQDQKFQEWVTKIKQNSKIERFNIWKEVVPTIPVLPDEITYYIEASKQQPAIPVVTPSIPAITPIK